MQYTFRQAPFFLEPLEAIQTYNLRKVSKVNYTIPESIDL